MEETQTKDKKFMMGETFIVVIIVLWETVPPITCLPSGGFDVGLKTKWWDSDTGVDSYGKLTEVWREDIFEKVVGKIMTRLDNLANQTGSNKVWLTYALVGVLVLAGMLAVRIGLRYHYQKKKNRVKLTVDAAPKGERIQEAIAPPGVRA